MATQTAVLGLHKPATAERYWDVPINANADILEGAYVSIMVAIGQHDDRLDSIESSALDTAAAIATHGAALALLSAQGTTDAAAPAGSVFLSTDHLDGAGAPQLCRKSAAGTVSVIG